LEEKVNKARRSQSGREMTDDQIDSLIASKNMHAAEALGAKAQTVSRPGLNPDSLLAGPGDSSGSRIVITESVPVTDSLGNVIRWKKMVRTIPLPQRYEQRIFRGANPTAFGTASGAAGRGYILGSGDEIIVSLWGDKEKEYTLQLNREGKVFLEGVGVVALAGSTLEQALQTLKGRLAKVYSGISRGTAHVDVSLGKAGPIRVFVLGEVLVPGGYAFSGHASPLLALYSAKGPTDIGTVRRLTLTRSGSQFELDLYGYLLRGEGVHPEALQDGDILFAGRAEALVSIEGDVGRPATYELKKGEGVKDVLGFAGGLNATAASQKITLRRIFEGGRIDFLDLPPPQDFLSGKANVELRDGDKLLVRKSTDLPNDFLAVSGPVRYPGTYQANGVSTVAQLVQKAGGLREDAYLGRVHILRKHPNGSGSLFAYSLDSVGIDSIRLQPRDSVVLYSLKEMYLPDSVQIAGAVFKPGNYEFRAGMTAKDLVMLAGGYLPHHERGKLLVFQGDSRERKVTQIPLTGEEGVAKSGEDFPLKPSDLVQVPIDPRYYLKEVVTLEGLFMHPGKYALLFPGEKLAAVIERAGGFKDNGYVEGGRFFRTRDSVGRVGVDLARAVNSPHSKVNIPLVGGDSIFVPERLNTVKVVGEVGFETSVLFRDGASVQYYLEKAGGFTRRSERDRVVLQYANGETSREGYFNRKPDAGSAIYVPRGPEPQSINWVGGIQVLLGTLTAAVTLIILANQVK
jgi:protein involved in polysaccharide export with SLBB domain